MGLISRILLRRTRQRRTTSGPPRRCAANWEAKELIDRATPELAKEPATVEALMRESAAKLGRLKEYKGPRGTVTASLTSQSGKVTAGTFVAEGVFEKGGARIEVRVVQDGDTWRIAALRIEPQALALP